MKEGQKRVKNDDFQEVARCLDCKNLFWADSEYELGNWQHTCNKCRKKAEKLERARINKIKKEGKPITGQNGILGWKLGKEEVFNCDYPYTEDFKDINTSNIDDLIRNIKRENFGKKMTILWHPILYEILLYFIYFVGGFGSFFGKKEIDYMGVKHKKYLKTDKYIVKL